MADFMSSELDVKCMHCVHNTAKQGIQKLSQFSGPERACKNGLSWNVYPPYIIRDSGMSSWPIPVIYIVFWPSATWWKTVFCVPVSYNL